MDEKTMVNDILNDTKFELSDYQNVITETENIQLRNTVQQLRNTCESFQYELYRVAETKGYYTKPEYVTEQEITNLKKELTN